MLIAFGWLSVYFVVLVLVRFGLDVCMVDLRFIMSLLGL